MRLLLAAVAVLGQTFTIGASLVNAGPDAGAGRVNVQIPAAVHRIGGTLECKDDVRVLHCDEGPFALGDNGTGTVSFIADAPGSCIFKIFLDHLAAADPNLADDADSLTVNVSAAPVSAGGVSTTPARPRAGTAFVVGFGVDGATVSSATCTSSVGTVASASSSRTFTRRFSVKLR